MSVKLTGREGERRGEYKFLVEQSEGKRPLGKSRCSWEGHIKMDF
jgi:hypothetical protein